MGKKFRNMKIKTQLVSSFMLAVFVTCVILVISIQNTHNVTDTVDVLYNFALVPLNAVSQATRLIENVKTEGRNSLLAKDAESREMGADKILKDIADAKASMKVFGDTILSADAVPVFNSLMEELDKYTSLMGPFRNMMREDFSDTSSVDRAIQYLDEVLSPSSTACLDILNRLNTMRLSVSSTLVTDTLRDSDFAFYSMLIFSVVGISLSVALAFYMAEYLSRPILRGVDIMSRAVEGDFSVVLPEDYGAEMGRLYASMSALLKYNRENVRTIMENSTTMRESAQNMMSISSHVADNSKGLNEQTSFASSAIEEFSAGMLQSSNALSTASKHISAVASSIEEINATIATVAAAAEETSTRVEQSSVLVENIKNSISMASGSVTLVSDAFNSVAGSVNEINNSIGTINDHCAAAMLRISDADRKAQNTNSIIQQLESASKQIGKIVSIISDIADQTNMLALNAAIEAAGAGEAGRGFMVVANEVKELARQTADSTEEIADQIENMQKSMPEAVNAVSEITEIINGLVDFMKSLTKEVTQQGKRSDQITDESLSAARRMNEITTEIGRITENALSVTNTVNESTKGVNEIAKSTADLVIGTQEIAMNSERASNNISEIDRATKEMSSGLIGISKNIQLIHAEAGAIQTSASQTNASSEELFRAADVMEKFVSKFKVS